MPDWMPDEFAAWADAVSLLDIIGWSAGIIAAFFGARFFVRKGWPWLKAFATAIINTAQIIDSVKELPEFIKRTDTKISEIHHEVHFNNGSSVKDAVSRVESGVAGLYQKVDELNAADAALRKDLEDTRPKPPKEEN